MKKAITMAAFLVFAASAHAQTGSYGSLNNAAPISGSGISSTGGGLNSDTGIGNASGLPANAGPSTDNIDATNPGDYIPSRFEGYSEAVIDGKAMTNSRPMTIAEMARQAQADKKASEGKKVMVLEQDSGGKLTIAAPKTDAPAAVAAPANAAPTATAAPAVAAPATVAAPAAPAATAEPKKP